MFVASTYFETFPLKRAWCSLTFNVHVRKRTQLQFLLGHVMPPPPKRRRHDDSQVLTLAGDCDGLGAGAVALKMILGGNRFRHLWASEICPATKVLLAASHPDIEHIYDDVTLRDHTTLPQPDVYVSGPPCQPFSIAGKGLALGDCRSKALISVVETISTAKPNVFLVEEVAALMSRCPDVLLTIIEIFRSIQDSLGRCVYHVDFAIIDSQNHGLAQVRKRLYIIGIKKQRQIPNFDFQWPPSLARKTHIDEFLLPVQPGSHPILPTSNTCLTNLIALWERLPSDIDPRSTTVVLDPHSSLGRGKNFKIGICPTLTRARCGCGGFYISRHQRFMRTKEMLRLQGFIDGAIVYQNLTYRTAAGRKVKVTRRRVNLAIGNSMSVPVVGRILHRLLQATGYIGNSADPWE